MDESAQDAARRIISERLTQLRTQREATETERQVIRKALTTTIDRLDTIDDELRALSTAVELLP